MYKKKVGSNHYGWNSKVDEYETAMSRLRELDKDITSAKTPEDRRKYEEERSKVIESMKAADAWLNKSKHTWD